MTKSYYFQNFKSIAFSIITYLTESIIFLDKHFCLKYNHAGEKALNTFDLYIKKFLNIPLWVKQVIYLRLKQEMRENLCEDFLDTNPEDIFANLKPTLTFDGETELKEKKCRFDSNIYNFLQHCADNYSIMEIAVNNYFSMEETAKYYEFCINQNYVLAPKSKQLKALVGFISGKFRTGEYLLNASIISEEQIDAVLTEQTQNPDKKFGDILTSNNIISEKELKALFILKEEAKKRFVVDYNKLPETKTEYCNSSEKLKNEIELLKLENKNLKSKMNQLLRLVK